MKKKLFALFLCLMLSLSVFPASAFASGEEGNGQTTYYDVTFYNFDQVYQTISGGVAEGTCIPEELIPANPTGGTCFHGWKNRVTGVSFDPYTDVVTETLNLAADWGDHIPDKTSGSGTVAEGDGATCTEKGWTTYPCVYCNNTVRLQDIDINSQAHDWSDHNGICKRCETHCSHDWSDHNGTCKICGMSCTHDWSDHNGTCSTCGLSCSHTWSDGVCSTCSKVCDPHDWTDHNGVCKTCGFTCTHDWTNHSGICKTCGKRCDHSSWADGVCETCGFTCNQHDWSNHDGVCKNCGMSCSHQSFQNTIAPEYLKDSATCTQPAVYYQNCAVCGKKAATTFTNGNPLDHDWSDHDGICKRCQTPCEHESFDEEKKCETCGQQFYSFSVKITGSGTVTWNGNTAVSEQQVMAPEDASVTFGITPASGYHVKQVRGKGAADLPKSGVTLTMNSESDGLELAVTFAESNNPTVVVSSSSVPSAIQGTVDSFQANFAAMYGVKKSEILVYAYDVTPYWNNDTLDPVDNADITEPLPFTLTVPSGVDLSKYSAYLYHYNADSGLVSLNCTVGKNGVTASSDSFSPMVLILAPLTSDSGTTVVVEKGTQAKPTGITHTDRIDNGEEMAGSISGVNPSMEYKLKGSTSDYERITGTKISNLAAGTYLVRYRDTGLLYPSEPVEVTIEDYYLVKARRLYGNGWYETDKPKYGDDDNTFVVKKGESIEFTFHPDSGYWLHEINVNGKYVGANNVKKDFTINGVKAHLELSYGFSSSSRSPKTADDSDVLKWSVMELVSLLGMSSITWYLFRKKEY